MHSHLLEGPQDEGHGVTAQRLGQELDQEALLVVDKLGGSIPDISMGRWSQGEEGGEGEAAMRAGHAVVECW